VDVIGEAAGFASTEVRAGLEWEDRRRSARTARRYLVEVRLERAGRTVIVPGFALVLEGGTT